MKFINLSIQTLVQKIKNSEISALEVCQAYVQRISDAEPQVQAYVCLDLANALQQAREIDQKIASREPVGILAGIPMSVKAAIATKEMTTSACSHCLRDYISPYEATVVHRLRQAGAILLGKNNMDQLSMGSSTLTSCYYPSHNPWDLSRTPGGSSGGGAAAVAALETAFAIGSDTGGSLRQPAAFCGIVGYKPSYGLVSRHGLMALAPTFDQIGPLAKRVEDVAVLLDAMAGEDPADPASRKKPVASFTAELQKEWLPVRIGLPKEYFNSAVREDIKKCVYQAASLLERLGAEIQEISLPLTKYDFPTYCIITPVEFTAVFQELQGLVSAENSSWGIEVKSRLLTGAYLKSEAGYEQYYRPALNMRNRIKAELAAVWQKVDFLLTPVTADLAFPLQNPPQGLAMRKNDELLTVANLAGLPAMSIPCGFLDELPVGMQLIGPVDSDARLLRLAYAFEQNSPMKVVDFSVLPKK